MRNGDRQEQVWANVLPRQVACRPRAATTGSMHSGPRSSTSRLRGHHHAASRAVMADGHSRGGHAIATYQRWLPRRSRYPPARLKRGAAGDPGCAMRVSRGEALRMGRATRLDRRKNRAAERPAATPRSGQQQRRATAGGNDAERPAATTRDGWRQHRAALLPSHAASGVPRCYHAKWAKALLASAMRCTFSRRLMAVPSRL